MVPHQALDSSADEASLFGGDGDVLTGSSVFVAETPVLNLALSALVITLVNGDL